jgi:hypothetical protein
MLLPPPPPPPPPPLPLPLLLPQPPLLPAARAAIELLSLAAPISLAR